MASVHKDSILAVFLTALKLGITSFGGPIAHIGYFREEYVKRRQWMDEQAFADMVALAQFLPGPASSKVGIGVGISRAGVMGGIAAWLGFTLPSALFMLIFAYLTFGLDVSGAGWLHGLKIVAVAVIAQAVWSMARTLAPDKARGTIAIVTTVITLYLPGIWGQLAPLAAAGCIGYILFQKMAAAESIKPSMMAIGLSKKFANISLLIFMALLIVLPLLRNAFAVPPIWLSIFDSFYRAGSLVFGGGHVILPILEQEFVAPGLVSTEQFMAGYGAVQAVPGPLFTFAAYLGPVLGKGVLGFFYGILALFSVFLPAFLLMFGTLPYMQQLRSNIKFRAALIGINAAVVGLLLAALYQPVWTSTIRTPLDFVIGVSAFALLTLWRVPPWLVVVLSAAAGWFFL